MTDVNKRNDLLWARDGKDYGWISPPKDKKTYEKIGSTEVRCEYMLNGKIKDTATQTIYILRK